MNQKFKLDGFAIPSQTLAMQPRPAISCRSDPMNVGAQDNRFVNLSQVLDVEGAIQESIEEVFGKAVD
jgi:hypothetical protein